MWPSSVSLVFPKTGVVVDFAGNTGNEKLWQTEVLFRTSQTARLDFLWASSISVLLLAAILYVSLRESRSGQSNAQKENGRAAGDPSDARDRPVVTPKGKLRWYQYGMSTLLMLMLVTSLAMSCYAVKMQRLKKRKEWIEDKRYVEVPILGPPGRGSAAGEPGPPSADEVMRAVELVMPTYDNWPFCFVDRINVHTVVEPITDFIDLPRVYPLVGRAQLHHLHYQCFVHFTDAARVAAPLSFTTRVTDWEQVVYIDHNHLHMAGDDDEKGRKQTSARRAGRAQ
jgi:hypothetical protein